MKKIFLGLTLVIGLASCGGNKTTTATTSTVDTTAFKFDTVALTADSTKVDTTK